MSLKAIQRDESEAKIETLAAEVHSLESEIRFLATVVRQARDAAMGMEVGINRVKAEIFSEVFSSDF